MFAKIFLFSVFLGQSGAFEVIDKALSTELDARKIDPRLSPSVNNSVPVQIRAGMEIGGLIRVDVPNNKIAISTSIWMGWEDPQWTWNTSVHSNTTCLIRRSNEAWSPTFQLLNGDPKSLFRLKDHTHICMLPDNASDKLGFQRGVASVVIELVDTFETVCTFNVRYFPFDSHKCNFDFVGYMEIGRGQKFVEWKIDPKWRYQKHPEWILEDVKPEFKITLDRFGLSEVNRSHMVYALTIKRRISFYFMALFVPALVLTILTAVIFLLPVESGEKVSLGVSVLISFTVFQLLLYDALPKSENLPIFGILMGILQSLCGLSLLLTGWILSVYHRPDTRPIPTWMRRLVLWQARPAIPGAKVESDEIETAKVTWQDVANRFDRLLFIISAIVIIICCFVAIFMMLCYNL